MLEIPDQLCLLKEVKKYLYFLKIINQKEKKK